MPPNLHKIFLKSQIQYSPKMLFSFEKGDEMDTSILKELKTLRDEIKLKSHLLGMELKDEWEDVEKKFSEYESQIEDVVADFGKFNE